MLSGMVFIPVIDNNFIKKINYEKNSDLYKL
jgi:hypothetical protein